MMGSREEVGLRYDPVQMGVSVQVPVSVQTRKVSGKRCLSPPKQNIYLSKRHIKRKTNNPILMLSQNYTPSPTSTTATLPSPSNLPATATTAIRHDASRQPQQLLMTDNDVTYPPPQLTADVSGEVTYPITDQSPESDEGNHASLDDTLGSKTENEVSTDILGSFNSVDSTSIPWGVSQDSLSRKASELSYYSSSYTSWTKPEAGHRVSDSCVPNSSILDRDNSVKPILRSRSIRRSKKSSGRFLKRDSSADTSKDIDDIEDFEFDGGLDDLLHDDDDDDNDDDRNEEQLVHGADYANECIGGSNDKKRWSTLMESPDLAYGSLNPSADELSK